MVESNSSEHFMLPVKRSSIVEVGGGNDNDAISVEKKLKATATAIGDSSTTVTMGGTDSVSANSGRNAANGRTGKAPLDLRNFSDIDEDLHSRQLAVYGRETMRRLFASNILVSGLQGLGAETGISIIICCLWCLDYRTVFVVRPAFCFSTLICCT